MNRELLLSVLALDSYHRGYNPGLYLNNLSTSPSAIATVTLSDDSGIFEDASGQRTDDDIGFFAQSYNLLDANGAISERYISFRGTDSDLSLSP